MSLRDLKWAGVYEDGHQNLAKDLYRPLLSKAATYDRAVGYFSSQLIEANLRGISDLVQSGGKMRLFIGDPLSEEEFSAIKTAEGLKRTHEKFLDKLEDMLQSCILSNPNRLELLVHLVAAEKLEIKYGARRSGMMHDKFGRVEDILGNKIVFEGSGNETPNAILPGGNAEHISVFCNWEKDIWDKYGKPFDEKFDRYWEGRDPFTKTFDVPSAVYERIAKLVKDREAPVKKYADQDQEWFNGLFESELIQDDSELSIPEKLWGQPFEVKAHQRATVKAWKEAGYKGIFALATGAGKTITSLYAATQVYKAKKKKKEKFALVISVPYIALAEQWCESLKDFTRIPPIKSWESVRIWLPDLKRYIDAFNNGQLNFFIVVVVNRTMEKPEFQKLLSSIPEEHIMFIGDECHNHGSEKTNKSLVQAFFKIGLSATPFRSDDEEFDSPFPNIAKERILNYYSEIVYEYSLQDAINDGVLCRYDYHI